MGTFWSPESCWHRTLAVRYVRRFLVILCARFSFRRGRSSLETRDGENGHRKGIASDLARPPLAHVKGLPAACDYRASRIPVPSQRPPVFVLCKWTYQRRDLTAFSLIDLRSSEVVTFPRNVNIRFFNCNLDRLSVVLDENARLQERKTPKMSTFKFIAVVTWLYDAAWN